MDSQFQSAKMCSNHGQNAHRGGSLQGSPCWDVVRSAYADGFGGTLWTIRTPDTRNQDVGTLPPLPAGLQTRVIQQNTHSHDLCAHFRFIAPGGSALANAVIQVRPAFWSGDYNLGVLDSAGSIEVYGVHLGDTLFLPHTTFTVDSSMCTVTQ
jgi:hypothetical protein